MGRYYHGDIEGKFWFGVQDSRDAEHFGGKEFPIFDYDPDTMEQLEEQIGSRFEFTKEDLSSINEGIQKCELGLGEAKEKIDEFFKEKEYYNDRELAKYLELPGEERENMVITKAFLMLYARLELGNRIKAYVEENGSCSFDADFY